MAIPKYDEMYAEFLNALSDGQEHKISDIRAEIAAKKGLTAEELEERFPGKTNKVFLDRVHWSKTYLKKAGLVASAKRGYCYITDEGKRLLSERLEKIDNHVLERYESFREYIEASKNPGRKPEKKLKGEETDISDDAPDELISNAVEKLNAELADELLAAVMEQPPAFFEWLVTHLLEKMGYGVSELELSKTSHQSRDGGIDGIIRQDKLGFSKIYIQAKRWDSNTPVSRPDLQKFYGALPNGTAHGLFITTARFTDDAIKYAKDRNNIVLVDGIGLAKLMIEHNVGVSIETQYVIKKIDSDFLRMNNEGVTL